MSEKFLTHATLGLCKYYIKNSNRIIKSVDSEYICSLPQLSPTSESFLTQRYASDYLYKKKAFLIKDFFVGISRVLILMLSIRIPTKRIKENYSSLIISHDVINNNSANDFYFGSPKNISKLCGASHKLIYISHSLIPRPNKNNLILINRNLSLLDYLSTVTWYIKSVFFGLAIYIKKPDNGFRYLIFKSLARGDGVEGFLRSKGLIKLLHRSRINQLSIYMTIEGHSWEKMIIRSIRNLHNKNILIYGYSHSIIRRSTYWVNNLDKKIFSPDVLLISKKIYFDYIAKLWGSKIFFSELRLYKSLKPKINFLHSSDKHEVHILLLPEGLREEEDIFIDFAQRITKSYPKLRVSAKWHPNALKRIKSTNIGNILAFSEMENYTHVIYRGTYGIFDFLGAEKKLLYLTGADMPDTNPLFMMPDKFIEISSVHDLADTLIN